MKPNQFIAMIFAVFVCSLTSGALAQSYNVHRVPTPNADQIIATALNDHGEVVGHATTLHGGVIDATVAWLYSANQNLQVLPAPPGMDRQYLARDINSLGVIAIDGGGSSGQGWLYDGSHYVRVGGLDNDGASELNSINDAGQGAGTSWDLVRNVGRAFTVTGHELVNLWPGLESQGLAINDEGAVAGHVAFTRAFRWLPGELPEMLPAHGPDFPHAQGLALAKDGSVVGVTFHISGHTHAFIYTDQQGMELIPALARDNRALGINSSGLVVGTSSDGNGNIGWVWSASGGLVRLDGAIGGAQLTITDAIDINNGGEILCHATEQATGEKIVVTLAPVATSSRFLRGDANGDGAFDVADAVFIVTGLFGSGSVSDCPDAADANDDGALDVADVVRALSALFGTGVTLPAPVIDCGVDPTPDALDCSTPASCP